MLQKDPSTVLSGALNFNVGINGLVHSPKFRASMPGLSQIAISQIALDETG